MEESCSCLSGGVGDIIKRNVKNARSASVASKFRREFFSFQVISIILRLARASPVLVFTSCVVRGGVLAVCDVLCRFTLGMFGDDNDSDDCWTPFSGVYFLRTQE